MALNKLGSQPSFFVLVIQVAGIDAGSGTIRYGRDFTTSLSWFDMTLNSFQPYIERRVKGAAATSSNKSRGMSRFILNRWMIDGENEYCWGKLC